MGCLEMGEAEISLANESLTGRYNQEQPLEGTTRLYACRTLSRAYFDGRQRLAWEVMRCTVKRRGQVLGTGCAESLRG